MKMTEILIIIVNISILILPIIMLIENLIKRKYRILNISMLLNMFAWVYLSYLWNVRNPGFWIKCDTRILTLIASILLIASIITFAASSIALVIVLSARIFSFVFIES